MALFKSRLVQVMTAIETSTYKDLVTQLIKFQENQVHILQKLADLVPKEAAKPKPGVQFTLADDLKMSTLEKGFGEELTVCELAEHFGEAPPEVTPQKPWTKESAEAAEAAADNANDLYKIKARVANLARGGGAHLTPQGEMLANTFVHVLKSLYDFAETLQDKSERNDLVKLIRSHEDMPANLIAAAGAGVRPGPKR